MKPKKTIKTVFATTFAVLILSFAMVACSTKDEPTVSKLPTKPEALAAYDQSSAGIVKGILTGSTGCFKFSIKNGNDSIYCKVTFDGQTGMLFPTTDLSTWTAGQAFAANFSGNVGTTTVSVYFKCNADGTSPVATFTVPNHNIVVSIYKETSTVLVRGYEGTYVSKINKDGSETDRGIFNFIECNGKVYGTHTTTTHTSDPRYTGPDAFTATVANGKLTMIDGNNQTITFDISDSGVSGSFLTSEGTETTTVKGSRTL